MHSEQKRYFFLKTDATGEEYIESYDEVLIVAVDTDGAFLLAGEPAPAFGRERVLVLPGGTVEPDETLMETANRELQEELGVRAGYLESLGEFLAWPKYLKARSHIFLGRDLTPSRLPGDEAHTVEGVRASWDDIEAMILDGRLRDTRAIAAIYLARKALDARKEG